MFAQNVSQMRTFAAVVMSTEANATIAFFVM